MAAPIDPNLAAAQSAAAAAWAAASASKAQVFATYIAAAGSFLVAIVTGGLTLRESLIGRRSRRFAAVEGLRTAAMMISMTLGTTKTLPASEIVPFERLKALMKIAVDAVSGSAAQRADDRQVISIIHRSRRSAEGYYHLLDRVERAHPKLKVGEFMRVHGNWEDILRPVVDDINKLEA